MLLKLTVGKWYMWISKHGVLANTSGLYQVEELRYPICRRTFWISGVSGISIVSVSSLYLLSPMSLMSLQKPQGSIYICHCCHLCCCCCCRLLLSSSFGMVWLVWVWFGMVWLGLIWFDVLAKTPGLYLVPELRYPWSFCRPCCYPPPRCYPPPYHRHHHEANTFDVIDVLTKTPGLYLVLELWYPLSSLSSSSLSSTLLSSTSSSSTSSYSSSLSSSSRGQWPWCPHENHRTLYSSRAEIPCHCCRPCRCPPLCRHPPCCNHHNTNALDVFNILEEGL